MTAELGDPNGLKQLLRVNAAEIGQQRLEQAMRDAVKIANTALLDTTPPPDASMDEWHMEPIAESVEIRWQRGDPKGELSPNNPLIGEWTHEAAGYIELGVKPHTIEGDPWLVWEDRETDETIFRRKVEHPGVPAVGYARAGFLRAVAQHFDR